MQLRAEVKVRRCIVSNVFLKIRVGSIGNHCPGLFRELTKCDELLGSPGRSFSSLFCLTQKLSIPMWNRSNVARGHPKPDCTVYLQPISPSLEPRSSARVPSLSRSHQDPLPPPTNLGWELHDLSNWSIRFCATCRSNLPWS